MYYCLDGHDLKIPRKHSKYGKLGEMMVRRRKKHEYLQMNLNFSKDGACTIDMENYLKEIQK